MSADETILRELNAGYIRAFVHADAAWYDAHLTSDFACIRRNGERVDRATFLADAARDPAVEQYDVRDLAIRFHGDTALVEAVGDWRRKDGTTGRTRYIDVYVRTDDGWKVASAQLTPVTDNR